MQDKTPTAGDDVLAYVGLEPVFATIVERRGDAAIVRVPGLEQPRVFPASALRYEPKKPWLKADRWVMLGDATKLTSTSS